MNGNRHRPTPPSGGIPILRAPQIGGKVWTCDRGHIFRGDPPTMMLPVNPLAPPGPQTQVVYKKGVCLFCVLDWLQGMAPVHEVLPDAEEKGEPE